MTKAQKIAHELATLLKKYGAKLEDDGETVTFPNAEAARKFNEEWMKGR